MRMYLSGWQASRPERELRVIQAGALRYRCLSFANMLRIPGFPYYLSGSPPAEALAVEHGIGIMMDSGAFSFRAYRARLERLGKVKELAALPTREQFVDTFIAFVKKNSHKWDFYMDVDLDVNASLIYKNHVKILKRGIKPVPVFHGDDDVDYLRRYADLGHTLVSVGAPPMHGGRHQKRKYLDAVFNIASKSGLKIHGLALTSPWQVMAFPFFSVDSSSWSRVAGYGGIMRWDPVRHRLSILHVSEQASSGKGTAVKQNHRAMAGLAVELKEEGYDLTELQKDYVVRHIYNAKTMLYMARTATKFHKTGAGNWNPIF